MTPRSNSLSMRVRGIFACSSISRTSGRISRPANSQHAVAEQPLVLGQSGSSGRADFRRLFVTARNVIIRGDEQEPPSTRLLRVGCGSCRPDGAAGSARRTPAAAAAAHRPAAGTAASRPDRSSTPIFRTRHQLRSRRRHRHRQAGQPCSRPEPEDFEVTEDGKPQTIETFKLINVDGELERRIRPPRAVRNATTRKRKPRATTCGCSRFSRRLPRPPGATACARARGRAICRDPAVPTEGYGGRDVSALVDQRRAV